jgi:hypothetical protein
LADADTCERLSRKYKKSGALFFHRLGLELTVSAAQEQQQKREKTHTGPPLEKPIARRFDEKAFRTLCDGINRGLTITAAAKTTGFSRITVYSYLGRHPDKLNELKKQQEANWLSQVEELGHKQRDWRAFGWLLERNFPQRYALFTVQRAELAGAMAVEHKVGMVTEAELIKMAAIAAEVAGQAPRSCLAPGDNGSRFNLGNGNGHHKSDR